MPVAAWPTADHSVCVSSAPKLGLAEGLEGSVGEPWESAVGDDPGRVSCARRVGSDMDVAIGIDRPLRPSAAGEPSSNKPFNWCMFNWVSTCGRFTWGGSDGAKGVKMTALVSLKPRLIVDPSAAFLALMTPCCSQLVELNAGGEE